MCCGPWGHKKLDTTERLNWTKLCPTASASYTPWCYLTHKRCPHPSVGTHGLSTLIVFHPLGKGRKGKGFPGDSVGKESACNAGDTEDVGSIPGSGRSPGEGHGNPPWYSCLENPLGRGVGQATAHRVAESRTQPKRRGTLEGRTSQTSQSFPC